MQITGRERMFTILHGVLTKTIAGQGGELHLLPWRHLPLQRPSPSCLLGFAPMGLDVQTAVRKPCRMGNRRKDAPACSKNREADSGSRLLCDDPRSRTSCTGKRLARIYDSIERLD